MSCVAIACEYIFELQINFNGVWTVHIIIGQVVDKETNTIFLSDKVGKNKPLLSVYLGQDTVRWVTYSVFFIFTTNLQDRNSVPCY